MKSIWKSPATGVAAIILLTVAAYIPAMRGGFIWDDDTLITGNRMVKASDGLRRIWFTTEALDYYPLTWSLCWLEWRFWGNSAAGYHVANVLLHAVNAVLVWTVLRRLKIPGSVAGGTGVCDSPGERGHRGLDQRTEEHALDAVLRGGDPAVFEIRRRQPLALVRFVVGGVSAGAAQQDGGGDAACGAVGLRVVVARPGAVEDLLRSVPFFVLSLVMGLVTVWFEHNRFWGDARPVRMAFLLAWRQLAGRPGFTCTRPFCRST